LSKSKIFFPVDVSIVVCVRFHESLKARLRKDNTANGNKLFHLIRLSHSTGWRPQEKKAEGNYWQRRKGIRYPNCHFGAASVAFQLLERGKCC
jgi:hypothetical protein